MTNGFETTLSYVFKMAGCWVFIVASVGGVIVATIGIGVLTWNAIHCIIEKWSLVTGEAPKWLDLSIKRSTEK